MNIPFSISDILERIIPGSLFITGAVYFLGNAYLALPAYETVSKFQLLIFAMALAASYALGVVFNITAELIPSADQ